MCTPPVSLSLTDPSSVGANATWFAGLTGANATCLASVQQSPFCIAPTLAQLALSSPVAGTALGKCGCPNGLVSLAATNVTNPELRGLSYVQNVFMSSSFPSLQGQCIVALQSSPLCSDGSLAALETTTGVAPAYQSWASWGQDWCDNFVPTPPPVGSPAVAQQVNEIALGVGYTTGFWAGNVTVPTVASAMATGLQSTDMCSLLFPQAWEMASNPGGLGTVNNVLTVAALCANLSPSTSVTIPAAYIGLAANLVTVEGVCALQKATWAAGSPTQVALAAALGDDCTSAGALTSCGFESASGAGCAINTEQALGVWSFTDEVNQQRCAAALGSQNAAMVQACVNSFGEVRSNIIGVVNTCCVRSSARWLGIVLAVLIPVILLILIAWGLYYGYKCNVPGNCPKLDSFQSAVKGWSAARRVVLPSSSSSTVSTLPP